MYKLLILITLIAASSCGSPSFSAQATTKTDTVLICKSKAAYAYHRYECRGLKHCTYKLAKLTREKAEQLGYRPCKICYK